MKYGIKVRLNFRSPWNHNNHPHLGILMFLNLWIVRKFFWADDSIKARQRILLKWRNTFVWFVIVGYNSCKEHRILSYFFLSTQPILPFVDVFKFFTLKLIIGMLELTSLTLLFVFCFFPLILITLFLFSFFFCFFSCLSFGLLEYTFRIPSWYIYIYIWCFWAYLFVCFFHSAYVWVCMCVCGWSLEILLRFRCFYHPHL